MGANLFFYYLPLSKNKAVSVYFGISRKYRNHNLLLDQFDYRENHQYLFYPFTRLKIKWSNEIAKESSR